MNAYSVGQIIQVPSPTSGEGVAAEIIQIYPDKSRNIQGIAVKHPDGAVQILTIEDLPDTCPKCGGRGVNPYCPYCDGTGVIYS